MRFTFLVKEFMIELIVLFIENKYRLNSAFKVSISNMSMECFCVY
jgi:hypothetical protein